MDVDLMLVLILVRIGDNVVQHLVQDDADRLPDSVGDVVLQSELVKPLLNHGQFGQLVLDPEP